MQAITYMWRRVMGVEPTGQRLSTRPTGFEDRGRHRPGTTHQLEGNPCTRSEHRTDHHLTRVTRDNEPDEG